MQKRHEKSGICRNIVFIDKEILPDPSKMGQTEPECSRRFRHISVICVKLTFCGKIIYDILIAALHSFIYTLFRQLWMACGSLLYVYHPGW